VRHLQKMLDICIGFGITCDLLFNHDKSKCGIIGRRILVQHACVLLGDYILDWVDSLTYLGVEFLLGQCLKVNCIKKIRKFMAAVSSVLHCKVVGLESVFAEILVSKCLPILLYGLDSLSLDSHSKTIVTQAWNCAFRWLYGVGKYTSTRHLFENHRTMSMRFLLDNCCLSFWVKARNCENHVLRALNMCALWDESFKKRLNFYGLDGFCSSNQIKHYVKAKFLEYCE
jgi:hypothetical protein